MNCSDLHDQLALLLYGDLPPAEKANVEKHLAGCPDCRRELRALESVRRLLSSQPEPKVRIDLPELYREAAKRQERRLWRWRRATVLVTGVAALFAVLAVGLRLEARLEAHQLLLRWGAVPPEAPAPVLAPQVRPAPEPVKEIRPVHLADEQLQLLSNLIHALADDYHVLERQEREDASQFQARLQPVQQQNIQRCADLQHSIDALYLLFQKGE